jgi:probable HAF family extracellular repeat protein
MSKDRQDTHVALLAVLALGLLSGQLALAGKPDKPGKPKPPPEPGPSYSIALLGTLGGSYSIAGGVNSFGEVAGWSENEYGVQKAFLSTFDEHGDRVMLDLNGLISTDDQAKWYLQGATDINDAGQIVGWGYVQTPGSFRHLTRQWVHGKRRGVQAGRTTSSS